MAQIGRGLGIAGDLPVLDGQVGQHRPGPGGLQLQVGLPAADAIGKGLRHGQVAGAVGVGLGQLGEDVAAGGRVDGTGEAQEGPRLQPGADLELGAPLRRLADAFRLLGVEDGIGRAGIAGEHRQGRGQHIDGPHIEGHQVIGALHRRAGHPGTGGRRGRDAGLLLPAIGRQEGPGLPAGVEAVLPGGQAQLQPVVHLDLVGGIDAGKGRPEPGIVAVVGAVALEGEGGEGAIGDDGAEHIGDVGQVGGGPGGHPLDPADLDPGQQQVPHPGQGEGPVGLDLQVGVVEVVTLLAQLALGQGIDAAEAGHRPPGIAGQVHVPVGIARPDIHGQKPAHLPGIAEEQAGDVLPGLGIGGVIGQVRADRQGLAHPVGGRERHAGGVGGVLQMVVFGPGLDVVVGRPEADRAQQVRRPAGQPPIAVGVLVAAVQTPVHVLEAGGTADGEGRGAGVVGAVLLRPRQLRLVRGPRMDEVDGAPGLGTAEQGGARALQHLDPLHPDQGAGVARQVGGAVRQAVIEIAGVQAADDDPVEEAEGELPPLCHAGQVAHGVGQPGRPLRLQEGLVHDPDAAGNVGQHRPGPVQLHGLVEGGGDHHRREGRGLLLRMGRGGDAQGGGGQQVDDQGAHGTLDWRLRWRLRGQAGNATGRGRKPGR